MGSVLLLKWKMNEWNKAPEVQGSDLVHKAPPLPRGTFQKACASPQTLRRAPGSM